jgi:putative endonuclease
MRCVYLLQSLQDPARRYVGSTDDLERRLAEHNAGASPHTAKHRPWEVVASVSFADDSKAEAFERYLKQGSGHAFARRHFW